MARLLFRAAFLAVAVLLFAAAIPRLVAGLAVDAAFPVPAYLERNTVLSADRYKAAANALAHANSLDGRAQIARAESMMRAGMPAEDIRPVLQRGLSHAPAHARGWALLAELEMGFDRKAASRSLVLSIDIAPRDYFLSFMRAHTGAQLWEEFSAEGQETVLRQTRLLWTEPTLRRNLFRLLGTPDGAGLVTHAFVSDPDSLRVVNRWAAQRARAERREAEKTP